jgi:hypothetical protein
MVMGIELAGSPPPGLPLKKGEEYTPTLLDSTDLALAKSYLASLPTRGRVEKEPMERRDKHVL